MLVLNGERKWLEFGEADTHSDTFWNVPLSVLEERRRRGARYVENLKFRDVRPRLVVQFVLFMDEFRSQRRLNPSNVRHHVETALRDFQVSADLLQKRCVRLQNGLVVSAILDFDGAVQFIWKNSLNLLLLRRIYCWSQSSNATACRANETTSDGVGQI